MLNAKLVALYKQFPWLIALKDEIGNPSVVKVARLDIDSLQRWCGTVTTDDDGYFIKGYFFSNGSLFGEIHPRNSKGFWASLKHVFGSTPVRLVQTIAEAAQVHPKKDEISEIVLFGHDLNHYGSLQLYVYRMPEGKSISDLLADLQRSKLENRQANLAKAEQELTQELK